MANNLIVTLLLLLVTIFPSNAHSHEFLENLKGVEKGMTMKGVHQLKQYLQKYGYLEYDEDHASNANKDEYNDAVEYAVKLYYQQFFSLKPTGKLDSDTIIQMAKPRCGVPDIIHGNSQISSPQYMFPPGNPKWPASKTQFSYTLNSSVQVVDLQVLTPIIASAFGKWEAVTNFKFDLVSKFTPTKDMSIGFQGRSHGDIDFDGPLGALAHSFMPPVGVCHIDSEENWSTGEPNKDQFDLESVVLHEMGHLLGLAHSTLEDAVMFPTISAGATKRELNVDDIQGIHALYGI